MAAIRAEILVLGERPHLRDFLSECLAFEGHEVKCVNDEAELRHNLFEAQPDLAMLDAGSDGLGAMNLYWDLKELFPALNIIVYQCRNFGDVESIKAAVAKVLEKRKTPGLGKCEGSAVKTGDKARFAI